MSTVSVHTDDEVRMSLNRALLLYRDQLGRHAYATVHDIVEGGRGLQLGAGVPLAKEHLVPFVQDMSEQLNFSGYLPGHILYALPRLMVWWVPPASRRVWFQCGKVAAGDQTTDAAGVSRLGDRSGSAPHPGLVFAASGSEWFVRAVAGADRPGPSTSLHVAPYFNVWESGRICTGNVRLPDRFGAEVLAKYEEAFFRSRFTHPNMPKLVSYTGSPYDLWADLIEGKFATFPTKTLRPAKQTLDAWVKSLVKGRK